MEIGDYLGVIWRRLWILILVPAIAVGVVASYVRSKPATFASTADVAAPALVGGVSTNQYSGSAGAKTFVANFQAAATSSRIVDKVSKATGVRAGRIKKNITVTSLGTSSLLEVRYETSKAKTAQPVTQGVASETIRFLFDTQLELAQSAVDAAQAQVDKAEEALNKFTQDTGLVLADKAYESILQDIGQLESQQIQFQANGQTDAANNAGNLIKAKRATLVALAPQVRVYGNLNDQKAQAITRLNDAQLRFESAAAQVEAGDPKRVVTTSDARKVSRVPDLIQKAGAAGGAALFLAVGIVALLELWSGHRRRPTDAIAVTSAPTVSSPVVAEPRPAVTSPMPKFGSTPLQATGQQATFAKPASGRPAPSHSAARSRRWWRSRVR